MRSSDIFSSLLAGQDDLLTELKVKIFNDHLSIQDRIAFSKINAGNRDFYLHRIDTAIINDLNQAFANRGIVLTEKYKITVENFWSSWLPRQNDANKIRLAAKLVDFLQDIHPSPAKKLDLLYWLGSFDDYLQRPEMFPNEKNLLDNASLKFLSIGFANVFMNLGIQVDENAVMIATNKNVKLFRKFIGELHRWTCDFSHLNPELGFKYMADNEEFKDQIESFKSKIADVEKCLRELKLHTYADQFKQRMQVTFLRDDDAKEIKATYDRALHEHSDFVAQHLSGFKSGMHDLLKVCMMKNSLMFLQDKQSTKALYKTLTSMSERSFGVFYNISSSNDGIDEVSLFRNIFYAKRIKDAIKESNRAKFSSLLMNNQQHESFNYSSKAIEILCKLAEQEACEKTIAYRFNRLMRLDIEKLHALFRSESLMKLLACPTALFDKVMTMKEVCCDNIEKFFQNIRWEGCSINDFALQKYTTFLKFEDFVKLNKLRFSISPSYARANGVSFLASISIICQKMSATGCSVDLAESIVRGMAAKGIAQGNRSFYGKFLNVLGFSKLIEFDREETIAFLTKVMGMLFEETVHIKSCKRRLDEFANENDIQTSSDNKRARFVLFSNDAMDVDTENTDEHKMDLSKG